MNVHDSERLAGCSNGGLRRAAGRSRRRRRSGRLQHLRGARERRQPALRQSRPSGAGQAAPARHADRRRRLPGPEGPRHDPRQGAVGRRGLRHPQPGHPAGAARAGPAQREARSRSSRRCRTSRPTCPPAANRPTAAWVSISVGCNNTCTFCIVPEPARGRDRPPPGDVLAEIQALVASGRHRGHPARPERQLLRALVRRPAGVRQAAARVRPDRRPASGCASPARTRATSPTT